MVRRSWLVATMLVVVALIAVGCQRPQAQQPAAPAKPASQVPDLGGEGGRVPRRAEYPPFEMLDKDKSIVGYDIDLINNICQLANCKLDIKSTAWDGIFPALQKGDYDTVISGVTITAERAKTMDFSEAYMDVGQVVLVRADETRINGVDDLADKSVAGQRGSTNAEAATNFQKKKKVKTVKQFPTLDVARKGTLKQEADGGIIDHTPA